MASGNFISSTGVNLNLYITWASTINIAGNYSDVVMTAYLRHSSLYVGARSNQVLKAEGATAYYDAPAISYGSSTIIDTQIGQKTIRVYHNSDGTMPSCDLYGSYYFNGTYGGKSISTITASKVVALDTIPRKSIASVTASVEVNGTNQATCTITRYDASFTHKVTFYFGDFATTSYKQEYTGVGTSQAYAIPLAWMNAIPNATSGQAKVRVETFSGATSLGYNEYTFDITVPSTVIPVVTDIAFSKVADAFSAAIYAKGISRLNISGVTVTNQYSATTASHKYGVHLAANGEETGLVYTQAAAALETGIINIAGAMKLSCKTTDSRGRVAAWYGEAFTVYDYAAPSVTVTATRCDAAGNPDPSGEYIKIRFQATISPVNNDNSKVYTLKYKKTSDSTWTTVDVSGLTGYTVDQTYIRAASASYTWEVYGSAQDKVNTVAKTVQASTALVLMDFLSGGTGIAIGKVAETSSLQEINLATQFNKELSGAGLGLTNIPFAYQSTVATATAAKGTFSGGLFLGQIIDLILDNGNTAASPTIIIGGVTYSISGMPTTAKISTSANQTYRLKKTAATTLTFISDPDYVCEYGTNTVYGRYTRWASGYLQYEGTGAVDTLYTNATGIASGTFTLSASCYKYKMLYVRLGSAATLVPIPVVRLDYDGSTVFANLRGGVVHFGGTNQLNMHVQCTVDSAGTTVTIGYLGYVTHTTSGSHSAVTTSKILAVYGAR